MPLEFRKKWEIPRFHSLTFEAICIYKVDVSYKVNLLNNTGQV